HVEPPAFKIRENSTYEHLSFSGGLPIQQVSRETLLTMVEQGFGLTITSVIYRPDIALIPLPSARAPTAAIISSSDNDNPTLPLLLKCFDTPSRAGTTD
ncbi:hypothetical protein, partial [Aeromonas hydrophila]